MGMDHEYDWSVGVPGERLSVHIESHRDGRRAFDATLNLERRELTAPLAGVRNGAPSDEHACTCSHASTARRCGSSCAGCQFTRIPEASRR